MWPFKSKPKYPKQVLTDTQRELLDYIDNKLVELHQTKHVSGQMLVKMTGVPFLSTILPVQSIQKNIGLEAGESYVPRSVALVVDHDGNWMYFYAVRSSVGSDDITSRLFIDALVRTNNAR